MNDLSSFVVAKGDEKPKLILPKDDHKHVKKIFIKNREIEAINDIESIETIGEIEEISEDNENPKTVIKNIALIENVESIGEIKNFKKIGEMRNVGNIKKMTKNPDPLCDTSDFHEVNGIGISRNGSSNGETLGFGGVDNCVDGWGEFEIKKRQMERKHGLGTKDYAGMAMIDVVEDLFKKGKFNKPAFETSVELYSMFTNIIKKKYGLAVVPPIRGKNRQMLLHGSDLNQVAQDAHHVAVLLGKTNIPAPPKLKQVPDMVVDIRGKSSNEIENMAKPFIQAIEKRQIEVAKYIVTIKKLINGSPN